MEASVWFSGWIVTCSLASSAWCRAFGVAASLHHAAGELVDDDHLVVLDDVVAVALEQLVRAERLLHVMDDGDVLDVVQRLALEQAGLGQQLLHMLVARLGQGDDAGLLVELEVGRC